MHWTYVKVLLHALDICRSMCKYVFVHALGNNIPQRPTSATRSTNAPKACYLLTDTVDVAEKQKATDVGLTSEHMVFAGRLPALKLPSKDNPKRQTMLWWHLARGALELQEHPLTDTHAANVNAWPCPRWSTKLSLPTEPMRTQSCAREGDSNQMGAWRRP